MGKPLVNTVLSCEKQQLAVGSGHISMNIYRTKFLNGADQINFVKKLLEQGNKLTLPVILQEAATFEADEARH